MTNETAETPIEEPAANEREPDAPDQPAPDQPASGSSNPEIEAGSPARQRFGVGGRLFLAFGSVALLSVLGCAIAWLSYGNIEKSLETVVASSVPAMNTARELAAESAFFSAAAPMLGKVDSAEERQRYSEVLRGHSLAIGEHIEHLAALGVAEERIAGLTDVARGLSVNMDRLDSAVSERLAARDRREAATAEVLGTQTGLLESIAPLVDDANFELVIGGEEAVAGSGAVIDRLVNQDVTALRSVLEIEAAGNLLAGLLGQALTLRDGTLLGSIAERFEASAKHMSDALEGLPDDEAYAEVIVLSTLLLELGQGEQGIFEIQRTRLTDTTPSLERRRLLRDRAEAASSELAEVHKSFLKSLTDVVDSANFELVVRAEDAAAESAALVQSLTNEGIGALRTLLEANAEINLMAGLLTQAATVPAIAELQPLRERFTAAESHIANIREKLTAVEGADAVLAGLERLTALGRGETSLFALRLRELEANAAGDEVLSANNALAAQLKTAVSALVGTAAEQLGRSTESVESAIDSSRAWMICLALGSLAMAGLIAWLYVGRNLVRRLVALSATMEAIAGGDLQAEVQSGGSDEVAAMAQTLHVFRDGLRDAEAASLRAEEERAKAAETRCEELAQLADSFESSVMTVVEGVGGAASQLQSTAEGMTGTVQRASGEAGGAASAIDEASSNVSNVAGAAEELTASIRGIAEEVGRSAEFTKQATDKAQRINSDVEGLAESADRIGQVVRLLSDIAEQTNLLALNATIEAARAGEAGRGFAVVASEVKALANQTGQATQQIEEQIGDIQTATKSAVQDIREITETVEQTHRTASDIASAIEQQDSATQEISRNVQNAASGTARVSTNIGSVAEATQQTGAAAENVLTAATDLSDRATELRGYVDQFLSKVRAA